MATDNIYLGSPDNPRTAAIVGYITVIGWLIAYFALYNKDKGSIAAYHLRQTLLLHIIGFILDILSFLSLWSLFPGIIVTILGVILFILWIWGLIYAVNQQAKPVPIIGKLAQRLFKNL
ncbi:MAG TPA: hypothetical protein VN721_15430 [Flavipsychrobacter sp.]|nr:hypothetical protein [Flavipsychrobacter sp.]